MIKAFRRISPGIFVSGSQGKARKRFFFEKKKQKTFLNWATDRETTTV